MRCGNIRIHVEIPVYADKNNCFCDDNHVSYSIPAIREACETASNLPIIQYDEQGTEKVVGVAQSIKWNPHGFIEEFAAAVRKLIFDADPGVQLPF